MNKQEQIKTLEQLIEATEELNGEYQEGWSETIDAGKNLLKDLKSNAQDWIKIEDLHPHYREHREVLVYMPNAYTPISTQTVYSDKEGGSMFRKGWNKGEGCFEVTHWMLLPENPKE